MYALEIKFAVICQQYVGSMSACRQHVVVRHNMPHIARPGQLGGVGAARATYDGRKSRRLLHVRLEARRTLRAAADRAAAASLRLQL